MNPIIRANPLRMLGFHCATKDTMGLRIPTSHRGSFILSRKRSRAGLFGSMGGSGPEVEGSDPELELHRTVRRSWIPEMPMVACVWCADELSLEALRRAAVLMMLWTVHEDGNAKGLHE